MKKAELLAMSAEDLITQLGENHYGAIACLNNNNISGQKRCNRNCRQIEKELLRRLNEGAVAQEKLRKQAD
jgi:hypothetical protein